MLRPYRGAGARPGRTQRRRALCVAAAAQPVDGHRVVGEGAGVVEQGVEQLVVARRGHAQLLPYGPLLGPGPGPAAPLQGEHGHVPPGEAVGGRLRPGSVFEVGPVFDVGSILGVVLGVVLGRVPVVLTHPANLTPGDDSHRAADSSASAFRWIAPSTSAGSESVPTTSPIFFLMSALTRDQRRLPTG